MGCETWILKKALKSKSNKIEYFAAYVDQCEMDQIGESGIIKLYIYDYLVASMVIK